MKTPHTHTSSCQDILPHGLKLPRKEVNVCMTIPNILALDCDGMREYFEASRRSYMKIWPDEKVPGDDLFAAFRDLRPVIITGWEMPLLLRAIVQERPESAILQNWAAVRDDLMNFAATARCGADQRADAHARRGQAYVDRHRPP
jgi:hypothetical protein